MTRWYETRAIQRLSVNDGRNVQCDRTRLLSLAVLRSICFAHTYIKSSQTKLLVLSRTSHTGVRWTSRPIRSCLKSVLFPLRNSQRSKFNFTSAGKHVLKCIRLGLLSRQVTMITIFLKVPRRRRYLRLSLQRNAPKAWTESGSKQRRLAHFFSDFDRFLRRRPGTSNVGNV